MKKIRLKKLGHLYATDEMLCMAEQAGCKAFNGYSMLIWQGAEAFRIWTGQEMPVDQVRTYLKRQ